MPQQTFNICEVPKGRLKVAQDVVVGNHHGAVLIPQGTAEILHARIHPPQHRIRMEAPPSTEGDENFIYPFSCRS
jgi:hypothetical protein